MKMFKMFFALGGILLASGLATTEVFAQQVSLRCDGKGSIKCDAYNVSYKEVVQL